MKKPALTVLLPVLISISCTTILELDRTYVLAETSSSQSGSNQGSGGSSAGTGGGGESDAGSAGGSATCQTPSTDLTNVVLLMRFNDTDGNGGLTEDTGKAISGNVTTSEAESKFGCTSGYFDGMADSYLSADSSEFGLGMSNFTVEAYVHILDWNTAASGGGIVSTVSSSKNGFVLLSYPDGQFSFNIGSNSAYDVIVTSGTYTVNTWYHLAAVRDGSTINLYVDGKKDGTVTTSRDLNETALVVGRSYTDDPGGRLVGYIDNLRVSKFARYTADFSPPSDF